MDRSAVQVVSAEDRTAPPEAQTPGITREVAFASEGRWAGVVTTAPGVASGWHHHGDHDTYAYIVSGRARVEFGPGGGEVVEAGPGDWLFVPKGLVHRESNPTGEESVIVGVRLGQGPAVSNVEGPPE